MLVVEIERPDNRRVGEGHCRASKQLLEPGGVRLCRGEVNALVSDEAHRRFGRPQRKETCKEQASPDNPVSVAVRLQPAAHYFSAAEASSDTRLTQKSRSSELFDCAQSLTERLV